MAYDFNGLTQASTFLTNLSNPIRKDIVTVNGFKEAQEYKLFQGERIILLDANSDIIYLKEADSLGKYSLKVFECKDITSKYTAENTPANITQAQYDDLTKNLDNLTKLLGAKHEHNDEQSPEFDFSDSTVCEPAKSNKPKS